MSENTEMGEKNMNILKCFQQVAPYINDLTFNDIGITIAGLDRYIDFIR